MSDEVLAALADPTQARLSEAERAALRFAEAMTKGGGRVPDDVFAGLRTHFDDAGIVEVAAVVGLFNSFNRIGNALEVEITR